MSKLSQLAGKGKKVTISGVELDIAPLKVKDMDLFVMLEDKSKMAKAMTEIVKRTLQKSDSEITVEEVESISVANLQKIVEVIMEVNGLKEHDGKKKDFLNKMKDVQQSRTS